MRLAPEEVAKYLKNTTDEEFVESIVLWYMYQKEEKSEEEALTKEDMQAVDTEKIAAFIKSILDEIIFSDEIDSSAWWKKQEDQNIACAKAMVYIDKELYMYDWDSFINMVDELSAIAGMDINAWMMDEEELEKTFLDSYIKIAKNNPEKISDMVRFLFEQGNDERAIESLEDEKTSNPRESKIYKAMKAVLDYLKDRKQSSDVISMIEKFLKVIEKRNMNTLNIACTASHWYYKYLDSTLFGVISNNIFTVGNIIPSESDMFELNGYEYVCHKDINKIDAPKFDIAMMFAPSGENVRVDFLFGRKGYLSEHSIGIVEYFGNAGSIELLQSDTPEQLGKKLADACNKIVPKMWEMANSNPELKKFKPL